MSLNNLSKHISDNSSPTKNKLPPVELWDPPFCGKIDIQIKTNGDWFFNGTVFKRLSLVKLFASVLIREVDKSSDHYFLITPVEKVQIEVDDVPFVLTNWHWQDDQKTIMVVKTNVDDEFVLGKENPLICEPNGNLYVKVRRNLLARVHRNVYYQWVELASEVVTKKGTTLSFLSAGEMFTLGLID